MKRRDFLKTVPALSAGALLSTRAHSEEAAQAVENPAASLPAVSAAKLPRWRGFNLMEKFTLRHNSPYQESDFAMMAEWGFDFVRLPTDYRCWTDENDPSQFKEEILKDIDQAIEFGKQYKIHVNLNLHRGPGYCVNPPKEKLDLWTDEEALKQFCFQWKTFAERYKGIPSERLSFDMLNEPPSIAEETYMRVIRATLETIRSVDPERLFIVDGLEWGNKPVFAAAGLGIGQSTRGYTPMKVSHYKASWVNGENWPEPTWPLKDGDETVDREWLLKHRIQPFMELQKQGSGVHVGEWGCFNRTPHEVALAWMNDCLSLWKEAGWGWSMWNLRGSFGIVDSGRDDIQYEDYQGHKLDRKMLETLLADLKS